MNDCPQRADRGPSAGATNLHRSHCGQDCTQTPRGWSARNGENSPHCLDPAASQQTATVNFRLLRPLSCACGPPAPADHLVPVVVPIVGQAPHECHIAQLFGRGLAALAERGIFGARQGVARVALRLRVFVNQRRRRMLTGEVLELAEACVGVVVRMVHGAHRLRLRLLQRDVLERQASVRQPADATVEEGFERAGAQCLRVWPRRNLL